jgi:hypothetical protein
MLKESKIISFLILVALAVSASERVLNAQIIRIETEYISVLIESADPFSIHVYKTENLERQINEFCATITSNPVEISACQRSLKYLYELSDHSIIKRYRINLERSLFDIIIRNILDENEWLQEASAICESLPTLTEPQRISIIDRIVEWGMSTDISTKNILQDPFSVANRRSNPYLLKDGDSPFTFIDDYKLASLGIELGRNYSVFRDAKPWPHIVVDDLIRADKLSAISSIAENLYQDRFKSSGWRMSNDSDQFKFGLSVPKTLGKDITKLISELKSMDFIKFLEKITKINGLIPDPFGKYNNRIVFVFVFQ